MGKARRAKRKRSNRPRSRSVWVKIDTVRTLYPRVVRHLKAHPDELYKIRPRPFEELIAEILASFGWDVQLTPESKDDEYDIFAISPLSGGSQTSWIIECKKYSRHHKVGTDIARYLYGVKGRVQAANCMLVTTASFTTAVRDFAASRYDFDLRNFEAILKWLDEYQPHAEGKLYHDKSLMVTPPTVD